ncbi:MAG: DUF1553 domain-containing protein [Planctomycetales bacterium]|nr:DUF1553 domain-containing protein [Planctomycetales bacterium]
MAMPKDLDNQSAICRSKQTSRVGTLVFRQGRSLLLAIGTAMLIGGGLSHGMFAYAEEPLSAQDADETIDYVQQIRPLLANRCFNCHGPDDKTRAAELRIDRREALLRGGESEEPAVVPGDPDASELILRVRSHADGYVMPPAEIGPPLGAEEVALLERWILQGAPMQDHWSFTPPQHTAAPRVGNDWSNAPTDAFIMQGLQQVGLSPANQAEGAILARRLALDITGLPPHPADVRELVEGARPDAVDRYVDRLLASPGYGERWGAMWLDIARYADSQGYAQDSPRTIWPYRDWVIEAFNSNLPFDQFTIEQLAGDLLENPSDSQLIATAFHRNTMTNSEGGTDDEEFRSAAVVDRVSTTVSVWMGLTMACAQCHSHKYDPISQQEFYELYAVFNQTEDRDHPSELPLLESDSAENAARRAALQARIALLEQRIAAQETESPSLPELAADASLATRFVRVELMGDSVILSLAEVQAFVGENNVALAGKATQSSDDYDAPANLANDGNTDGHFFDAKSTTHTKQGPNPWWEVELTEPHALERIAIWNRSDSPNIGDRLKPFRVIGLNDQRQPLWIIRGDEAPSPSREWTLPVTAGARDEAMLQAMASWWTEVGAGATPEARELAAVRKQLAELKPDVVTPIMRQLAENQQRETFIHVRGNFRVPGDAVNPGLLTSFGSYEPSGPPTRLDVAHWLLDRSNPLTARVTVNRFWEQLFGVGLVETAEDFGTQGAWPTHPRLLDSLSVDFMDHDWDMKWLVRELTTSATYCQSSEVTPEKLAIDPYGSLWSRGPRFRLSAESIRDQALAIGGLLSRKMFGPSVRPPRPKLGLNSAFGGSTDWDPSPGEDRVRRGLYTSWRRTTPYPSMTTFDATSREVCALRRIRTNTPLQALVTLNDPVYVEAAQGLARRVLLEGPDSLDERLAFLFRTALVREATDEELGVLRLAYEQTHAQLAADPAAATTLATQPIGPLAPGLEPVDAATWTVLANVIMNLDEMIARP